MGATSPSHSKRSEMPSPSSGSTSSGRATGVAASAYLCNAYRRDGRSRSRCSGAALRFAGRPGALRADVWLCLRAPAAHLVHSGL